MSELERMNEGLWCDPRDPQLGGLNQTARRLCRAFNLADSDEDKRSILRELVGDGLGEAVLVVDPFQCDYPGRLILGDRVLLNYGCKILNCGIVTIEAEAKLAPGVTIVAVRHSLDVLERGYGEGTRPNQAWPVKIGFRAWIGAGAVVYPGVTVGNGAIILPNSAVDKDVPAGAMVGGVPAKFIRWTPGYGS
jgi:maltose O-acetyltransferase